MKKIIPVLLCMLCCMACEKDLDVYEGKDGIYFYNHEIFLDTVFVHWGIKNSEVREQPMQLKVCLFGNTKDYDRKFNVEVVTEKDDLSAATEGEDYLAFAKEYVMPAHQAEAVIDITVLRSDELVDKPKRFTVRLIESEELGFLYSRSTIIPGTETVRPLDYQRVVYMDELFPMPGWWPIYGNRYFGTWTATKCALICDVMGIEREMWVKDTVTGLSDGYLKFAGNYMQRWLNENPQTDENGEPMTMGPESQG